MYVYEIMLKLMLFISKLSFTPSAMDMAGDFAPFAILVMGLTTHISMLTA